MQKREWEPQKSHPTLPQPERAKNTFSGPGFTMRERPCFAFTFATTVTVTGYFRKLHKSPRV